MLQYLAIIIYIVPCFWGDMQSHACLICFLWYVQHYYLPVSGFSSNFATGIYENIIMTMKKILTVCLALVAMSVSATVQDKDFCIAGNGKAATIVVDARDWTGVARAARDLGDDVRRVCGTACPVKVEKLKSGKTEGVSEDRIIVGTIGRNGIIDNMVKQKRLDVSKVSGRWESFVIDVVDGSLVVAGSDKRGTIYGIYEVSRRIGVSPWYWWADVPVRHQDVVRWDGGCFVSKEPTVK